MVRKWGAILATTAAAACGALAGTASADAPQAGCQAYGAFVAETAQTLNSASTPGGGGAFVSGIATSGPGALADTATFLKQLTCP
jgi:hypothetical protein